jgi:hypothetical protein
MQKCWSSLQRCRFREMHRPGVFRGDGPAIVFFERGHHVFPLLGGVQRAVQAAANLIVNKAPVTGCEKLLVERRPLTHVPGENQAGPHRVVQLIGEDGALADLPGAGEQRLAHPARVAQCRGRQIGEQLEIRSAPRGIELVIARAENHVGKPPANPLGPLGQTAFPLRFPVQRDLEELLEIAGCEGVRCRGEFGQRVVRRAIEQHAVARQGVVGGGVAGGLVVPRQVVHRRDEIGLGDSRWVGGYAPSGGGDQGQGDQVDHGVLREAG